MASVMAYPLLSYEAAQRAGVAMHDRWVSCGEGVPPLSREDTAWADMFRAGYEAVRHSCNLCGGLDEHKADCPMMLAAV
jgi:hypothetical protein